MSGWRIVYLGGMNDLSLLFSLPVAGGVTLGHALLGAGVIVFLVVLFLSVALWRAAGSRTRVAEEAMARARETEMRMAEIARGQAEMHGRMGALADVFGDRQSELTKAIGERIDGMTSRLGQSLTEQTRSTHENLAKLQ